MKRFYAIDALRSVLALCVVASHAGMFPLFGPAGQPERTLDALARLFRTAIVFAPPAVIAFFVISGFCIHYPYAGAAQPCPVLRFYGRRYVRILVPVACTVALFKVLSPQTAILGPDSILWNSTLWSVLCEEIYYALYPAFNRVAPRVGWPVLLGVAFAASAVVMVTGFPTIDWKDVGVFGTALTLLPVWLLGCYLAEHISSLKTEVSPRRIWLWRGGAWGAMWLQLALHFHSPIHQTVSGVVLGVYCYFWLRAEIAYYGRRAPWPVLVWAGRWSYSLYLMHPIVIGICVASGVVSFQSRVGWVVGMSAVLLGSYLFYLAVERPSHRAARKIAMFEREPLGTKPALVRSP